MTRHADLTRSERQVALSLAPVLLLAAVVLGLFVARSVQGSHPVLALLTPLVLVPFALWASPTGGLVAGLVAAVTVEQFAYQVGPRAGAATSKIPFFHSITPGSGVTPAELFLGALLLSWALQQLRAGEPLLHNSPVGRRLAAFCGLTVVYVGVGLARHGSLKAALWEIRPLFYLAIMFVLASSLLTTTRAVRAVLWTLVLGSGTKALYGVVIFLSVRHVQPRPEAVLGHEESYFFGLVVFLVIGLWAFGVPGRLRTVATCVLPLVVVCDMANSRRTAWAILIVGGLFMTILAYVRLPAHRRGIRRASLVVLALSLVYMPLFWNKTGTTAQPARAVHSLVAPDPRDASSDQYRVLEDENLKLNIRAHHATGSGFGVPIDYAVAIPDLTGIASMLAFVPHNGVLWVFMRTGVVGEVLLWLVIGEGVLAACQLTRVEDRETAVLGALVAAGLLSYAIIGEKDLGFYWLRIAICTGVLLGAVEARLRVLRPAAPAAASTGTHLVEGPSAAEVAR